MNPAQQNILLVKLTAGLAAGPWSRAGVGLYDGAGVEKHRQQSDCVQTPRSIQAGRSKQRSPCELVQLFGLTDFIQARRGRAPH